MEIPKQLQNKWFRFILISMCGQSARKRPLEIDWQNRNNYSYSDIPINMWITGGNNYGVVCGYGNLAVIDADHDEISFLVENRLPKTFTVKTGSGGKHFYYIIPDFEKKIVLQSYHWDDDKKDYIADEHFGEIQFKGSQVVGPTSIHPNGNKYEIISDLPIAKITSQHIVEIFEKYIKPETPSRTYSGENNYQWVDISKIINLDNFRQKGGEFVGKHPVHGSSTGGNFSINVDKSVFHCFRCGTGGGPISLIAMLNGLLQCQDIRPGCITNEIYQKVLKIAKEKYNIEFEGL